jgi:hypothetical protein
LPRRRGLPPGLVVAAVFPALDEGGAVRYVQARSLDPGCGPKHFNPGAALAVNPRLAWTQTVQPRRPGLLLVCEGLPDALIAAQAGYRSVAMLGAHAPDERVALKLAMSARRDRSEIVAIIDNDDAGCSWGQRLTTLLVEHGHRLTVLAPPVPGDDLNSWAQEGPSWTAAIDALQPSEHIAHDQRMEPTRGDLGLDIG